MTNRPSLLLVLCALLALAGCDDDSMGGEDSGPGGGMDAGPMPTVDSGPPMTDAGSATDAGGRADSGGGGVDGSAPGDGGAATDGSMGSGACTNAADQAALGMVDIAMVAEDCGRMCFGGRTCVIMCVERDAGISNACATCFGDVSQCTLRNCLRECSGSDMMACDSCRAMAGCTSAFEACSGLPGT